MSLKKLLGKRKLHLNHMRITIVLAILLSSFVFLGSCGVALAQDTDIGTSLIHPAHPFYFLKTVRENIEIQFAQTPRVKMVRQLEFATRRVREVKALVSMKNHGFVEPTLERYWFHMNTVIQYRPREEWLTRLLNHTIATHLKEFEKLYEQTDQRGKRAIRTAIFRILNSSDIPAEERAQRCKFLIKEASASGLNETEATILQERSQKCFKL